MLSTLPNREPTRLSEEPPLLAYSLCSTQVFQYLVGPNKASHDLLITYPGLTSYPVYSTFDYQYLRRRGGSRDIAVYVFHHSNVEPAATHNHFVKRSVLGQVLDAFINGYIGRYAYSRKSFSRVLCHTVPIIPDASDGVAQAIYVRPGA